MAIAQEAVDGIEKIDQAREAGIRFIQLQFTDVIGAVKAVTIPIHQLEGSVRHGTWFDGSSVEGFTRIAESDRSRDRDHDRTAETSCSWSIAPLSRAKRPRRRSRDTSLRPAIACLPNREDGAPGPV